MDEIELLRRYGARTAASAHMNVDVTARVMQTLRSHREDRLATLRPLAAVAAAGWVAVLATGVLVQQAWSVLQDPIASLLSPFVVALQ